MAGENFQYFRFERRTIYKAYWLFLFMRSPGHTPYRMQMDAYKALPEGTRVEMIDNMVFEPPAPTFDHQDILLDLAVQLKTGLKNKAKVVVAPFDVYLDEVSNAVQPDIVVILDSNKDKESLASTGHLHGVPDIVVEILSPANKRYDMVKKRELYQKFRVQEYWIVDPAKRKATVFILDNHAYRIDQEDVGVIHSKLLRDTFAF
jgi:Uma2 family endonuclease